MQRQQYIIVNKTITKSMNTFDDSSESIVVSKEFSQLRDLEQREIKKFRTQRTFFDEINKRKKTITNESSVSMIQSIETMILSQISSSSQRIRKRSDKSTSSIKNRKTSTIKKRIKKSKKENNFFITINRTSLKNVTNRHTRSNSFEEC